MVQYLLNATLIWLLSLVVFDLFLGRETFHTYNRIYLLGTFIMGIILPLIPWHTSGSAYTGNISQGMATINTTKATLVAKATPTTTTAFSTEKWLLIIYLTGACIMTATLIVEITKLVALYRNGHKQKEGRWTIITTNKQHSPFSLFRYVFVSANAKYTGEEWQTILQHEQQHGLCLHFIDVCIMQLSRIVCWFHPLVYAYEKRLLLIHEYQADDASATEPAVYGKFLIEQALLQPAPQLTHSFNRSPIKKRIVMLTHKTTRIRHLGKLLIMPLIALFFLCCTKNMYSQTSHPIRNGNTATYNGNTILFGTIPPDTIILLDPVTGDKMMKVTKNDDRVPVKLNNEPIYNDDGLQTQLKFSEYNDLHKYVVNQMKDALSKLPDGFYKIKINNIVIGPDGKIAYYDYGGIVRGRTQKEMGIKQNKNASLPKGGTVMLHRTPDSEAPLGSNISNKLDTKLFAVLNSAPVFAPAQKNGKNVAAMYGTISFWNYIKVKNHQVMDYTGE